MPPPKKESNSSKLQGIRELRIDEYPIAAGYVLVKNHFPTDLINGTQPITYFCLSPGQTKQQRYEQRKRELVHPFGEKYAEGDACEGVWRAIQNPQGQGSAGNWSIQIVPPVENQEYSQSNARKKERQVEGVNNQNQRGGPRDSVSGTGEGESRQDSINDKVSSFNKSSFGNYNFRNSINLGKSTNEKTSPIKNIKCSSYSLDVEERENSVSSYQSPKSYEKERKILMGTTNSKHLIEQINKQGGGDGQLNSSLDQKKTIRNRKKATLNADNTYSSRFQKHNQNLITDWSIDLQKNEAVAPQQSLLYDTHHNGSKHPKNNDPGHDLRERT